MLEKSSEPVGRFSKEDVRAFESMVERYEKPIYNMVYRMVGDREDAMDITQSAFVKAYENLERYDPSFKFFSWLCKIAVNESLNLLAKRKHNVALSEDMISARTTPDEDLTQAEISEQLQRGLSELAFDYRVVLILRHFLDFSYKEIGNILEIPEKTVKSRLFTGRQLLRDVLAVQGYVR